MVVDVLIINCQVSEKFMKGPLIDHRRITKNATIDAAGLPTALVIVFEMRSNTILTFVEVGFIIQVNFIRVFSKIKMLKSVREISSILQQDKNTEYKIYAYQGWLIMARTIYYTSINFSSEKASV